MVVSRCSVAMASLTRNCMGFHQRRDVYEPSGLGRQSEDQVNNAESHHSEGHDGDRSDHCGHCGTVDVHVNNKKIVLQPGPYDVPTFKRIAGVPQADDLDELVNCKLKPVPDNASIHIHGCEVFISHVKDGGAS